jgi:hypothetical protein
MAKSVLCLDFVLCLLIKRMSPHVLKKIFPLDLQQYHLGPIHKNILLNG